MKAPIRTQALALCLACFPLLAQTASKAPPAAAPAPLSASDKAGLAQLKRAKTSYQASQYKEAEDRLNRLLKQNPKSSSAEEAMVMLADVQLRQSKPEPALATLGRFRRNYGSSAHLPRMDYYQGLAQLRLGRYGEALKSFAASAAQAPNTALYQNASRGVWHLVEGGGPTGEDMDAALEILDRDPKLKSGLLEKMGDQFLRDGKYQAAKNVFQEWLERYPDMEGEGRIKDKLKQAEAAPQQNRVLMLMAPLSGDFAEIGRSLKEGATMAVDENNLKGGGRIETRLLDDQGNMIVGIHRLRKALREEKIDALVGPAMSDVSAAAAVDLSARKSKIPMVTPTATTHGIAALGEGIFQINVTTATLGLKIASYAMGCLKLKDFAILAPQSEYGYQLADAFQKTVEKKGGLVVAVQYYDPEATDLAPQFEEIRKQAAKLYFEKEKTEKGAPDPDAKTFAKALSDSVLPLDGIFLAASNGEEAYKLSSQASFHKLKAQYLGSSGWNDKSILHKSSTAALGAYFSVDFQENPKTEAWTAFQKAYAAKWKHAPDKVAALAYDASRFLIQGMSSAPGEDQLIPALRGIRSFNGVMGRIVFDEKTGANQNAALYRVEKRGFKEVEPCPEAD